MAALGCLSAVRLPSTSPKRAATAPIGAATLQGTVDPDDLDDVWIQLRLAPGSCKANTAELRVRTTAVVAIRTTTDP